MLIIILSAVGGVLVLAGIIIAIVFITGSKSLSCEQKYETDYYKMTATLNVHYMFGNLSGISMTEEDWQKDGISDDMIKQSELTEDQMKESGYKSYKVTRKDDNTVTVEAEYDLDSEKFEKSEDKSYKEYDKAKKYFEDHGFTCKD